MKKKLVLCLAVSLFFVLSASAQKTSGSQKFTTSGFYNGIEMTSKESGDYGGTAVYLTESDGQLYALVMTAEGAIFDPVLVEAKQSGKDMRTVEFTLPGENGDRKFKGTVSAAGLKLDGGEMLKRQCANTYSDISMGSGGDYGGMEVYLTDAGGSWFALVTIAEGVLMKPVLVEAKVTGKNFDKVEFTLPNENGNRKFTGTIAKTGMTVSESGTRSVLKNKCYK
jgi:hypothetical protein